MKKKLMSLALALALGISTLSLEACGSQKVESPDSITIQYEGTDTETVEVKYGTADTVELSAVLDPSDFDGEITWSSDDAGIAKVAESDGASCTVNLVKVGTAKITATCGEISDSIKINIEKNQEELAARDVAYTINGEQYSVEWCNIYFVECYNLFVEQYGSMASYYGLDTSQGISSLANQDCDYSDDGTWWGFFISDTLERMKEYQALCDYAEENGITLDDSEEQEIDDEISDLEQTASDGGYSSVDAYIHSIYGDNTSEELYREYLETYNLAMKVYNQYVDSLTYTDEEIAEHYTEMGYTEEDGNDYPMVSMRHILIMAEADADGNYTDEAIQAAHDKAEEIYEEWKSGDATEDSFAELAEEYSEDTGSNTDGGLYENIYKDEMVDGINDWIFADGRAYGDTTIVDNNGSYVGTHVVFFCGQGEEYSTYLSESDLQSTDCSDWINGLVENYDTEEGEAASSVGKF